MNEKRGLALHWNILIALFLGVLAGYLSGDFTIAGTPLVSVYEFIGQLFLNALKMLIVPLIASSIALGVACCTVIVSRLQGEDLPALKANGKS